MKDSAADAETLFPLRPVPGELRSEWGLRLLQLLLHPLQSTERDQGAEREYRSARHVPAALRCDYRGAGSSHVLLERRSHSIGTSGRVGAKEAIFACLLPTHVFFLCKKPNDD